jgi:N-acetylmuramic acid 6-phosphate etherase
VNYAQLPTEQINVKTRSLNQFSTRKILQAISEEDQKVPEIVARAIPQIERAVELIVKSFRQRGKLFLMGAGTSGRLGVLEAAECPPTFNTPPSLIQAYMAGGRRAVFRSQEGAEDRGEEARKIIEKKTNRHDTVVGISASGVTAFAYHSLKAAKEKGCSTVLVTCNQKVSRLSFVDQVVALSTGPEVIAGSTRLKAGTATKLALNMMTVGAMVRMGKTFGNRMVDLQPRSKKLEARAARLVQSLSRVSEKQAKKYLKESRGNAKTAILMARRKLSFQEATRRLKIADGFLELALQGND